MCTYKNVYDIILQTIFYENCLLEKKISKYVAQIYINNFFANLLSYIALQTFLYIPAISSSLKIYYTNSRKG